MEKQKLELKHIAPYLPYGVKVMRPDNKTIHEVIGSMGGLYIFNFGEHEHETYGEIGSKLNKPILQPLSDYTDINSPAMVELNCDLLDQIEISSYARSETGFSGLNYHAATICFENHIDIFKLIEKGLAVDTNTIK